MGYAILPALCTDIGPVYDVYFEAFQADHMGSLMLKLLFPGGITPEFREQHTHATLSFWQQTTTQYTYKCVDSTTGEIVGMVLVDIFLHHRREEECRHPEISWLGGEQRERAEKVVNALHDLKQKLIGGRPHIYAHVMAIKPSLQGKKVGKFVVEQLTQLVDQLELPLYFESSPSSYGFYVKTGFEALDQRIIHDAAVIGTDTDIEVIPMVKMPQSLKLSFAEWSSG